MGVYPNSLTQMGVIDDSAYDTDGEEEVTSAYT
jgi:hypothetical protein